MKRVLFALLVAVTLMATASATVVTSIPGGTVYPMANINYFGAGPQTVAPGITWSSAYTFSVYGYSGGYGFVANGFWQFPFIMAGTNDGTSTMTFAFSTPVSAVGGFLNYAPGFGSAPVIAAYDSGLNLIESYTLNFSTGGGTNTGFFYGLQESTPISYFTLTGSYIGITDLTAGSVPEPGSMLLLGTGLLGVLGVVRRKINL